MPPHKLSHWISNSSFAPPTNTLHRLAAGGAVVAAALVVSALVNRFIAKRAERKNPPMGKFVVARGVRVHYVEEGEGDPLVFLHGNAGMIQDFASSGLMSRAAGRYRGHRLRPSWLWLQRSPSEHDLDR